MSDFVHLHLHTTYSLLDGQCSIAGLVAKVKALGMSAVAVTDHGNLFALKAFYDEAKKQKIKPILGVEAYVTSTGDHTKRHEYFQQHKGEKEKRFHLCLHAKNLVGYHNLVKIMSEAHINGFYHNARIDHRLLEQYHEGLHCSSACIAGEIAYYLDDDLKRGGNDPAKAEEIARWYQSVFGDDYSLEIMLHPSVKQPKLIKDPQTGEIMEQITPETIVEMKELYVRQQKVAEKVLALGKKLGIRVIATNDVHFLEAADDDAHDVLLAMSTQKKMSDTDRMIYTGQEYFKTEEEMRALFPDHPEVIAATKEVADKVEVYELNSDPIMPKFPIPASFGNEEEYAKRFDEEALKKEFNTDEKPENYERLGGYGKVLRIKFEADYLESLVYAGAKRRWGVEVGLEAEGQTEDGLATGGSGSKAGGQTEDGLATGVGGSKTPITAGNVVPTPDGNVARASSPLPSSQLALTGQTEDGLATGGSGSKAEGQTEDGLATGVGGSLVEVTSAGETFRIPKDIKERIDFELNVIKTMGFPGYFLIVNDYIDNARKMGVWVGPGRGSAAGAAVAYALGITNVDPIKYDLLFERFLNPDRISMPDIDVDFDDAGRPRVLEFVTQKYGQDHVAHIVTFGQLAAKSVIKDVGRAMGYPLADTNKLVATVPDTPKITFKKATNPKDKNGNPNGDYSQGLVDAFNSSDPTIHLLMERAKRLEGGMRQPGIHACGVIISRDPLIETLPVMPTEGESLLTTQYDGHFVEPVGLLKMDFLGLKTLTVEKECVNLLGPDNPRVPEFLRGADGCLDPDKIPDDDKETYELFGRGETTGLFQFESDGMKKWLMALKPTKLTDLVAMNALYRPGPMDYIPTFVRRKKGEEPIVYDHPLMEKYLKDTYGVCVYQEQVMLLSRLLGGFTRGMSDKLRKAMGKKQLAVMEELKVKFVDGCLANPEFRIDKWKDEAEARKLIDKIWDDWRAFASYAFNKSHAVCYAWVAYQTGYLKAHYPAEFMCAQISSEIGNFDKLPGFVAEAQEMGLELRLPDVNESGSRFVPTKDAKGIRYGLSGIKGVGAAGDAIIEERQKNGPYAGFLDFCMRLAGTSACNKRVLENLTRTGAFATLETNRAKLFNNIEYALKKAQQKAKESASAQTNFFDLMSGGEEKASDSELVDTPSFTPAEDLKNERDFLGVYVSGHPLQSCRRVMSEVSTFHGAQLADAEAVDELMKDLPVDSWKVKGNPHLKDKRGLKHLDVRMVGILSACTVKLGRPRPDGTPGQKWAILTVDDGTPTDAFCFAKAWEAYNRPALGEDGLPNLSAPGCLESSVDRLVLVCGEISHRINYEKDDKLDKKNPAVGDLNFTLREAYPLEAALPLLSKGLRIKMQYSDPEIKRKVDAIRAAILRNPGTLPVLIELHYPTGKIVDVNLGQQYRVATTIGFLSELGKIVPQADTTFAPSDKIYLEPPKPKPWEC